MRTSCYRLFAVACWVAGAYVLSAMVGGCGMRAERPDDPTVVAEGPTPQQESWSVSFRIMDGETPRVHLAAGHAAEYVQPDSAYVLLTDEQGDRRVSVHLFDAVGDSSALLTAERVRYYQELRQFVAQGDVRVRTADDRQLYTERLVWLEDDRSIHAPGFVRLRTPTENINGYDLHGNEALTRYRLGSVTGHYLRGAE